jgi:hypothetical protein
MTTRLILGALLLSFVACVTTPTKKIEASSTLEDLPNEPVDAGTAAVATPAPAPVEAPAPAPVLTFVKVEATEGFSVMMPKDPQEQRNSVALPKNAGTVNNASLTSSVDGVVYSVTRSEYPAPFIKKIGAKKMLGEVRSGLSGQLKGTVSDEKDVELSGHPGQTFTVAGAAKMVRARSALVGGQLFTMVVIYSGNVPEKADEFLNSLALKDPPPPPAPAAPKK